MIKKDAVVPLQAVELKPCYRPPFDGEATVHWLDALGTPNPSAVEIVWFAQFLFRPEKLKLMEIDGDASTVELISWRTHTIEAIHCYPVPLLRWLDRDIIGLLPCIQPGALLSVKLQLDALAREPVRLQLTRDRGNGGRRMSNAKRRYRRRRRWLLVRFGRTPHGWTRAIVNDVCAGRRYTLRVPVCVRCGHGACPCCHRSCDTINWEDDDSPILCPCSENRGGFCKYPSGDWKLFEKHRRAVMGGDR
jgi:hypothetical protein